MRSVREPILIGSVPKGRTQETTLAGPSLPAMKEALKAAAGSKGRANAAQYVEQILEHAVGVLEGKTSALVYPATN